MHKVIDLPIDQYQTLPFIQAVRTKRDVIVLWMNAIKAYLTNDQADGSAFHATLSLVVMSMSRLFCELASGEKVFSVAFPFFVRNNDEGLSFHSRGGVEIDHRVSSQVLMLIEGNGILEVSDFSAFIDPLIESADIDERLWSFMRELMVAEDGYIRYDWDRTRMSGHLHPEYHLDFYYSSAGTFKLGLEGALDRGRLISILDVGVDCHYLVPAQPPKR
ncbi:hypothetical protein MTR80_05625 [Alcaligenes aquatilis]|uniref:Uncharacterized protein n=1 Tax=Alcaligenes aquatilis TaxID=323284 RepID=A0ABY4NJL5_9BURK|nr:hypothetical protein [Alcaligenes aquatilis]UQN37182.1 hypothetical protein MTR80_05625 [Alcaligenes aquatilis]